MPDLPLDPILSVVRTGGIVLIQGGAATGKTALLDGLRVACQEQGLRVATYDDCSHLFSGTGGADSMLAAREEPWVRLEGSSIGSNPLRMLARRGYVVLVATESIRLRERLQRWARAVVLTAPNQGPMLVKQGDEYRYAAAQLRPWP
jgi:hypothetical protein